MGEISDLKQKKDVIKYQIQTIKWVERDSDGLFEHIGSFFGKSYYTARRGTEERTQEIELGVNEQQVINIAHGQLDKLFRTEVPGLMKKISDRYLEQVSKLLKASANEIQTAWQTLENLKCRR